MDKPVVIRSLVCHRHVPMAVQALGSLVRFHRGPVQLALHDDGTLGDEDRERLSAIAPGTVFISRAEADGIICEHLARHPACLQYRRSQTMALKLFDPALLSAGTMQYCDCDILFLRPFAGFAPALAAARRPLVLMRDLFNTYSLGWRRLLARGTVPLADRVNAGIMLLEPAMLDLDFIEWFLRRPESRDLPNFAEQTAWSALLQKVGGSLLDAGAFTFPPVNAGLPPPDRRPVAWHFVGPLRRDFEAAAAAVAADQDADHWTPAVPEVFRPATLNFPRYCVSRWHKDRLARRLAKEALPA